ncbi:MAG TPA: YCF48-related protein [Ignavibacteria bacterium]|nr:YCF48-related protein [Ignavibacteria bacterium]HMS66051.1 YCF48-related protein [Ignavibacteria bacterium]
MKSKLLLLFLFVCICFTDIYSQQDVNGWYWLNGKPTGNTINWVKVIDASTFYAVGFGGTFMKSTDGGDTWALNSQVGTPSYPDNDYLGTLPLYAGWFFDANTGIVAGQSSTGTAGKISRTTDGGNTWNYIQYSNAGGTVKSIYFINSLTGYFTGKGNAKFFKTTDGGLSWVDRSNSPAIANEEFSSIHATDTSNIFVCSESNPNRVYKYNPSTGWTLKIPPGSVSFLSDITFKDANTGYVCGNTNYFAYTTNGGNNWIQSNAPSTNPQHDLVYNGGNIYSAGDYSNIYKSSNNGINWSSIYFKDASNLNQPRFTTGQIIYGIDVNGSDMAVVGIDGAVTISNDGGASWRNKNYSVTNNNNALLYASIYLPTSGTSGLPAVSNNWLGPHEGGNILFSSNAGANWTTKPSPSTQSVKVIQFINSNTGYICGGSSFMGIGEMSKTTNGGTSWTNLTLPAPLNALASTAMCFVNANTGWVATEGGFSAKTTNGGASFTVQTLETSTAYKVTSIQMLDANTGYAMSSSLYKTTNGGTNWIKTTNPFILSGNWSNFYLMSKDIIILNGGGATNKIARSVDGGTTFTDISSNLVPNFYVWKTKWINLKHGVACGTGGLTAKTTNGGLSWSQTNPGGSTTVDLAFPNKNEWYTISDRNSAYEVWRKYDNITSLSFNITMGIEGFRNGSSMTPDTVTVELRNSASPYNLADQSKEFVTGGGFATYEFYNAPAGSYYMVLKHRNSLETWSSVPVTVIAGGNYNYDFTTSVSQSFGNLSVLKSGAYCIISGDVNQDQTIDASDLSSVENSIDLSGYVPEDLTGDDYVDAADLSITENNQGISYVTP